MSVNLAGFEERTAAAVSHYWTTLDRQEKRQTAKDADRGRRAAVTGGKQMDGFCSLLRWFLTANGLPDASIHTDAHLEIPGFFRATKKWDLLVVHEGQLVACCEFKSQRGPSFGNNLNNRTEEALGNAVDVLTAYREKAFGEGRPAPWLGWITLLEDCEKSRVPVTVREPHFPVFPDFDDTSYADRWAIMLNRLLLEKKYDGAALLLSSSDYGPSELYSEPDRRLTMKSFLAGLGGHVSGYVASL